MRIPIATLLVAAGLPPAAPASDGGPSGRREIEVSDGRCTSVHVELQHDGPVMAYVVSGEFDPLLRALDDVGAVQAADDDSGEHGTPLVQFEGRAGQRWTLEVDPKGGAGSAELVWIEHPQSAATVAEAERLSAALEEVRALQRQQLFEDARAFLREIFERLRELPDATCPAVYEVLVEVGDLAREVAHVDLQVEAWSWILEIAERDLPPHHSNRVIAKGNLATALREVGNLERALALQEQVLASHERYLEPEDDRLQIARCNLAMTLVHAGELERAERLFRAAVDVYATHFEARHPNRIWAEQAYGVLLGRLGHTHEATRVLEAVYSVALETHREDDDNLQVVRFNLAQLRRKQDRHHEARALLEQVDAVWSRKLPDDSIDLQKLRYEIGANMYEMGDVAAARGLMEQALSILSRQLPENSQTLMVLRRSVAATHRMMGDHETARAMFDEILRIQEQQWSHDRLEFQYTLLDRAYVQQDMGEYEAAWESLVRADEGLRQILPEGHPDIARCELSQSWTAYQLGDRERALELARSAVAAFDSQGPREDDHLITARQHLARLLQGQGCDDELVRLLAEISDGFVSRLSAAAFELSMREAEAAMQHSRYRNVLNALLVLAPKIEEGRARDAALRQCFRAVESMRGIGTVTQKSLQFAEQRKRYAECDGALPADSDCEPAELSKQRTALRSATARIARLARESGRPSLLRAAVRDKEHAERELRQLVLSDPRLALRMPDVSATTIAGRLEPGQVAIGYWQYRPFDEVPAADDDSTEEAMFAFVLRADGSLTRVELGSLPEIEELVQSWRAAVVSNDADVMRSLGERLRERIVDPVARLSGDAQTWFVALDAALHLVPLDALPTADGVVGDRTAIKVRCSLSELTMQSPPQAEDHRLVAFGAIDYDASSEDRHGARDARRDAVSPFASRGTDAVGSEEFTPLPDSGAEVREIAGLARSRFQDAPEPIVVDGAQASHTRLIDLAPKARYLHLATHGFFVDAPDQPAAEESPIDAQLGLGRFLSFEDDITRLSPMVLCGLALAGANGQGATGPGTITAEELAGLDLSRCELAVLSGCDTGLGRASVGQGVASLQKALYSAGARCVLTSLWKVSDRSTRELMTAFYRGLWVGGLSKHEALWQAKQELRARRVPMHDWAAWVLSGE